MRGGDRAAGAEAAGLGVSSPHGSGFSGRVGWGSRPAVVVVDLVRAYTEPDGPFALDASLAVPSCASLVEAARSSGVPVVWTEVRYAAGLSDAGLFGRKVPALACGGALVAAGRLGRRSDGAHSTRSSTGSRCSPRYSTQALTGRPSRGRRSSRRVPRRPRS